MCTRGSPDIHTLSPRPMSFGCTYQVNHSCPWYNRQTVRQTKTVQSNRQTDSQTNRQTHTHIDRQTRTHRPTGTGTDTHIRIQIDRQTGRHTHRNRQRQSNRQTDRQAHTLACMHARTRTHATCTPAVCTCTCTRTQLHAQKAILINKASTPFKKEIGIKSQRRTKIKQYIYYSDCCIWFTSGCYNRSQNRDYQCGIYNILRIPA